MKTISHCKPDLVRIGARWPTLVALSISLLVPGVTAAQERVSPGALQQIQALQQEKASRPALHRKLDSQFVYQLKQNRGQAIAQGVTRLRPDVKLVADGQVLVDMDAQVTETLLRQIEQSGGKVINSFPQYQAVRAWVPLGQLENLAGLAKVKYIRRAREARTHTGSETSEGDVTHGANLARSACGVSG
jgi:hypothetical protein